MEQSLRIAGKNTGLKNGRLGFGENAVTTSLGIELLLGTQFISLKPKKGKLHLTATGI